VLVARNELAALALEMAEQGRSTAALPKSASEDEVRAALQWNNKDWPWATYGPAVMLAVGAGVPVLGANLPRAQMRPAMDDRQLELRLKGPALKAQQQLIRFGHCELLPESQITPMTRIQIARDIAMAQTVTRAAVPARPCCCWPAPATWTAAWRAAAPARGFQGNIDWDAGRVQLLNQWKNSMLSGRPGLRPRRTIAPNSKPAGPSQPPVHAGRSHE